MSTQVIYVISNGAVAYNVLNAIAAFCNATNFKILIGIGAVFGFVGTLLHYVKGKNPAIFMEYFGWYFLVTVILTGIRFDVQVIDMTDQMATYNVANVPFGVVVPAEFASEIMEGIAQFVDDVFHTTDDLNYLSTGMLYGSKIMEATLQPPPITKDQQQNVDDYYRQCILPDILINKKYTFDDLAQQTDLISFLASHASELRGIYIDGAFNTCAQAISTIKSNMNYNMSSELLKLQNQLQTSTDKSMSSSQFATDLQGAYSYYLSNLSQDSSSILMQNVMIGALRQAAMNNAANFNSTAAQLINYSQQSGIQSMLLEILSIPKIIADWLPMIQTVGFMIGMCMFPFVILFLMIPGGVAWSYLKGYVGFFVSICSWPAIYDVINYITNLIEHTRLPYRMDSAAGITLSNIDQLQYYNSVAYGIAGLLAISFTIGGILGINKLGNTLQGAAQNLLGFARNSAGSVATSVAQGNISTGNMSAFNGNANKTDLNESFTYGMQSFTNPNTGMTDKLWEHGGKDQFIGSDASNFMIGGNYQVNFAHETSAQLQQMASQSKTAAQSMMTQASSNLTSNLQQLDQFTNQTSDDKHLQTMFSQDHSGQFMQSYQAMQTSIEKYGQDHNWTKEQTNAVAKTLAFGGEAKLGGGKVLSGSASLSGNREASERTNNNLTSSYLHSLGQEQTHQLDNQRQNIQSYMSQVQSMEAQGQQLSKGDQVIANISKDVGLMTQANAEFSQSQQYESMASSVQNSSASFNQNMMPQFEKYLRSNASTDPVAFDAYHALLNKERGMNLSQVDSHALTLAQNSFVTSQLSTLGQVGSQVADANNSVMNQANSWQSSVASQGQASVASSSAGAEGMVNQSYHGAGGRDFNRSGFDANAGSVQHQVAQAQQDIKQGQQAIEQETQSGKGTVDKNSSAISKNEDRGLWATELNNAKQHVD